MADDFDRQLIQNLFQTGFAISIGAAFKSVEMMLTPLESAEKLLTEMQPLFVLPEQEGLTQKAEAMAGVWMERAAALVDACKTAGERFTEGN